MTRSMLVLMSENRIYTGIGSRVTPLRFTKLMSNIAEILDSLGFQLRTGDARGADRAFSDSSKNRQIYGPDMTQYNYSKWCEAEKIMSEFCLERKLEDMTDVHRRLAVRNTFQILDYSLDSPTAFVVCWTPTPDPFAPGAGGTRYACRLARSLDIPVINLNTPTEYSRFHYACLMANELDFLETSGLAETMKK